MSQVLIEGVLAGKRRAVARAISLIENNGTEAHAVLAALHPHTGRAHLIGVTGPPGSGKSTLVNALALQFRRETGDQPSKKVGILAVDPTSPFSGGAILGDRIRMRDLSGDRHIFIRSMASRGNLGGLAWATADAVKVLDAAGFDLVIIETVGAGQAEVDIARTAHTTVVVEVPGLGDDIQAIKAGILEIADVFAVNKADHDGSDHAVMALRMMLDLGKAGERTAMHHGHLIHLLGSDRDDQETDPLEEGWRPPIQKTVAIRHEGIPELAQAILAHRAHLEQSGALASRERERAAAELETMIQQESLQLVLSRVSQTEMRAMLDRISQRETDPYTVCQELLRR